MTIATKIAFDTRNSKFVLVWGEGVFVGSTLNKKATLARTKGLFIICKISKFSLFTKIYHVLRLWMLPSGALKIFDVCLVEITNLTHFIMKTEF